MKAAYLTVTHALAGITIYLMIDKLRKYHGGYRCLTRNACSEGHTYAYGCLLHERRVKRTLAEIGVRWPSDELHPVAVGLAAEAKRPTLSTSRGTSKNA